MNEALAITVAIEVRDAGGTPTMGIRDTPTGLHGPSGLETRDAIGRHALLIRFRIHHTPTIGVMSRQVEQINTGEDYEESAQQRNRADRIGGIETLEENKRGADRCGREGDIVKRIDAAKENHQLALRDHTCRLSHLHRSRK